MLSVRVPVVHRLHPHVMATLMAARCLQRRHTLVLDEPTPTTPPPLQLLASSESAIHTQVTDDGPALPGLNLVAMAALHSAQVQPEELLRLAQALCAVREAHNAFDVAVRAISHRHPPSLFDAHVAICSFAESLNRSLEPDAPGGLVLDSLPAAPLLATADFFARTCGLPLIPYSALRSALERSEGLRRAHSLVAVTPLPAAEDAASASPFQDVLVRVGELVREGASASQSAQTHEAIGRRRGQFGAQSTARSPKSP